MDNLGVHVSWALVVIILALLTVYNVDNNEKEIKDTKAKIEKECKQEVPPAIKEYFEGLKKK